MEICAASKIEVDAVCTIDQTVMGNKSRVDYLTKAILDGKCVVAKIDGTVAGFIVVDNTFYGNAFIWLVMVSSSFRRQGVATALIRHVEVICPTEKLFTSTNESNAAMKQLCEYIGFVRSGWIENLDEDDPEVVYFKRVR